MNEKPSSMPLKEWLIKRLAQKLSINEKIVELVVNEQFTEAYKQTSLVNTVEFSGFGKFIFSQPGAHKMMESYVLAKQVLEEEMPNVTDEHKLRVLSMKLFLINKNIEHLKPKLR